MDKDLLRIVIIAIGVVVMLGMVLWSVIKNKKSRRGIDFYDKGNPLDNIDESLIVKTENDEFDIVPLGSAVEKDAVFEKTVAEPRVETQQPEPGGQKPVQIPQETERNTELPKLIQFSLVAVADEGFQGLEMVRAFKKAGLIYGSVKVFERLDNQRRVDFAVASMVEPGTFPDDKLLGFSSPGIVFFLQPYEVDDPLAVFDDFIHTIHNLSIQLNGVIWDHNRQPLSNETIHMFRRAIKQAMQNS